MNAIIHRGTAIQGVVPREKILSTSMIKYSVSSPADFEMCGPPASRSLYLLLVLLLVVYCGGHILLYSVIVEIVFVHVTAARAYAAASHTLGITPKVTRRSVSSVSSRKNTTHDYYYCYYIKLV